MGDQLDTVTQRFEADVAEYAAAVQEAAATAQEFAAANTEAKAAVDGVRDHAVEASAALNVYQDAAGRWRNSAGQFASASELAAVSLGHVRDSSAEAGAAVGSVRDKVTEAAAALKIYRDEQGKLRDQSGLVITATEAEARALKHIRDQALEASWAMRDLEKYQRGSALSGLASKLGGLFGGGSGSSSGGAGGALSGVPLLGSLIESPQLLLAIVPAIMAVVTEVGALATGLTAAGLGVGGFAALALPAFKSVTSAYAQINKDQQAYDRALTATAKNNALKHLQQDYAALDPAQRGAVQGLQSLVAEYHKLSKAFEPTAFKVFNEGLKIANQLLPYIGKFANAAAPAIEGLLTSFSKGLDSPAFKKFMDFLASLSGPVITAIGSGMAGLAKDVMQLMEQFSKKDVLNAVNIAFRLVGAALTALIWIIKISMGAWDLLTKAIHLTAAAFDLVRHDAATAGHDIASAFDTARHAVAEAGHDIAHAFDTVRHAVATIGDDIVKPFKAAANWIESNWKNILGWILLPVLMAAGEIYTHTHQIAQAFDQLRHDVAAILAGARHDIATAFDNIRHDVAAIVVGIPGDIRKAWDTIRHDAAALGDDVLKLIEKAWNNLVSDTSKQVSNVLSFFEKLPGQIVSFLAKLPGEMVTMGVNIVEGMIRGVESQANALKNAILDVIPGPIRSVVSAALGLLSPSRVFHGYGVNIVQGLINGVRAMQPHLQAAMRELSGGVTAPGSALAAGGGGSLTHNFNVNVNAQGALGSGFEGPRFEQYMQQKMQEAVLRYAQLNPTNGLTPAWGR